MTLLASDSFNRTTTGGWGSADSGGAYAYSNSTYFSCNGANGIVADPPGTTAYARLGSVSSTATEVLASVGFNALPNTAGGIHAYVHARSIADSPSSSTAYGADLWVDYSGAVMLARRTNNVATDQVVVMTGFNPATQRLNVRVQAFGLSPTTIRARAWLVNATEPTTWNFSVTDSTASHQVAGAVSLGNYMTASSSNTVNVSWDSLQVNDVAVAPAAYPITVSATSAQRIVINAVSVPSNGGTVSYNISPSSGVSQPSPGVFSVPVPANGGTATYTVTATETFGSSSVSAYSAVQVTGSTGTSGSALVTLVRRSGAWI